MASKRLVPRRDSVGLLASSNTWQSERGRCAARCGNHSGYRSRDERPLVRDAVARTRAAGVNPEGDATHVESCSARVGILRGSLVFASVFMLSGGCATHVIFHDHHHGEAGEGGEGAEAGAEMGGRSGASGGNGGASATAGSAGIIEHSTAGSMSGGRGGESGQGAGRSGVGGGGMSAQIGESGQGGGSGEAGVDGTGGKNSLCGNGTLDAGEACDDGNSANRDGCSGRCAVEAEFSCSGTPSLCIPLSSCAGMVGNECAGDDCCASPQVTGGTVLQGDENTFFSTVSTFRLDKFEVTVGRFRRFMNAYDSWRPRHPIAGEGQHPRLSSASSWQPAYDDALPQSAAALRSDLSCDEMYQTWSSDTAHDTLPINCVNWYAAFAFCIWDGGRLPTESEWEYAAAGGNAHYTYPWGNSPAPDDLDGSYAVYNCLGNGMTDCAFDDIQPVGSRPLGMARYGQLDLAGSMWESTLDLYAPYPTEEVSNYANLDSGNGRVSRGGDWYNRAHYYLRASYRGGSGGDPAYHSWIDGLRCARDL